MIRGLGVPFWQEHVTAANSYNGSGAEYAKAHGITSSALYYWQKKFRLKATTLQEPTPQESTTKQISSKKSGATPSLSSQFVALRVAAPVAQPSASPRAITPCTLLMASQVRLELSELPDPQWLVSLVRATQGAH
jgi:transposase-like protein